VSNAGTRPDAHGDPAVRSEREPRSVVVLGSTGSIGTQALDVIARNRDRFRVTALAAGGGRPQVLAKQVAEFGPEVVAVADPAAVPAVREALGGRPVKILAGPDGVAEAAAWPCDVVLNGVTGALGLASTLAALRAGRMLALANKESLIIGGPLVKRLARPGQLVPLASGPRSQRVVIARPRSFDEVQDIAEHLKNRRPLILNLEDTDKETAQRILNFLSGTIYALNGEMYRIANGVVFFAPQNVETVVDRPDFLSRD